MRLSKLIKREQRKQSKKAPNVRSIAKHKAFVPILAVWGAVLLGGTVIVLPADLVSGVSNSIGLGALGGFAHAVVALMAAVMGGLIGFLCASTIQRRTSGSTEVAKVEDEFDLIDPATDLGSSSLDDPVEEMPFAKEGDGAIDKDLADLLDYADNSDPGTGRRRSLEQLVSAQEQPEDELLLSKPLDPFEDGEAELEAGSEDGSSEDTPRELGLEEFAALPGLDGVWIEAPIDEVSYESEEAQTSAAPTLAAIAVPEKSALEKLRERPTEELSMVEMVERFAGALHERQSAEREHRSGSSHSRDSALADALKALSLFTEAGFDAQNGHSEPSDRPEDELDRTERDLRAALNKLQNLRGAA